MVDQIKNKIAQVNALLHKGEPDNISEDTYSHYTGYKPQAVIDAMNDAFDIGEWGFEEISNDVEPTKDGGGLTVAKVKVWIKGVEFQPTGWGQSRVTKGDIGDARKGAQTDAIKKSLSYFSIGNRAYHGLLPGKDDKKGNTGRATSTPTSQSTKPATSSAPVNKTDPKPENKNLGSIPTASQLRKEVQALNITSQDGQVMDWQTALNLGCKVLIKNSQGNLTLETLLAAGDDLGPDYCNAVNQYIARFRKQKAA